MHHAIFDKHLERWLPGYVKQRMTNAFERPPRDAQRAPGHVLFALCDHFEPFWRTTDRRTALARVRAWTARYPELARGHRDADRRPPRHTFFFPGEDFDARLIDELGTLAEGGFGELELHLHHEGDDESSLRARLARHVAELAGAGHLGRGADGRPRFAFIHGNWALANGRPDGRHCGVDAELPLLFEAGCYCDFTFPAVPDVSQPNVVNSIYWPVGDLAARRSYERQAPARVGQSFRDRILLIQGPLAIARDARRRLPRLEYGALTANDPPARARVGAWIDQHVHVRGRPEWTFVKVHTHGAPELQAASLLGPGGAALHAALRELSAERSFALHYVTAREMFNVAMAAMAGESGDPARYRDFVLAPPPRHGQRVARAT